MLVTGRVLEVEEERYFVTKILQARGPNDMAVPKVLDGLEGWRAGLLLADSSAAKWQLFSPSERVTLHNRNRHGVLTLPAG